MKLLRITAEGQPLFKEKLDICLYAQQRVSEEHQELLHPQFSNIYLNPTNAFIDINASGKSFKEIECISRHIAFSLLINPNIKIKMAIV